MVYISVSGLSLSLIEMFYSKSLFNVWAHYTELCSPFWAATQSRCWNLDQAAAGGESENEQPNASPTRQLEHGDSSPSVIRPETQPDSDHQPRCSTPSSPPPWGGTSTTTRRCTTCRCSPTSSQTSSQTSTVSEAGEGKQTISKSIVFLSSTRSGVLYFWWLGF